MPMKLAALFILLAGLTLASYGTWYHLSHPSRTVSGGTVTMTDSKSGKTVSFYRRTREVGSLRFEEVRLPGGTWIDCRADCRATLRREQLEFWEHQQLQR